MDSLQLCQGPIRHFQLMQGAALKIALEISLLVPQPTFLLHEGRMDDVGHWHLFHPLDMVQTLLAPLFHHPVLHKRSYTSYHINQHQMNFIFCLNISVPLKALPVIVDVGPIKCDHDPEVSALDVLLPAVTMK